MSLDHIPDMKRLILRAKNYQMKDSGWRSLARENSLFDANYSMYSYSVSHTSIAYLNGLHGVPHYLSNMSKNCPKHSKKCPKARPSNRPADPDQIGTAQNQVGLASLSSEASGSLMRSWSQASSWGTDPQFGPSKSCRA